MAKLVAAIALAGLIAAPAARAATDPVMPAFPTASNDGAAMLWLRDNTSLGVGQFVAFGPDNVLVVLTDEVSTRTPHLHRVSFRQEAVKVDFVARMGGRSLRASGEVDCRTGAFKTDRSELFMGSDLRGARILDEGPDPAPRAPRPGSGAAMAAALVCGGDTSILAPLVSTARREAPGAAVSPPPSPVPAAPVAAAPARPVARAAPARPRPAAPSRALPAVSAAIPPPAATITAPEQILAQIGAFASDEAAERAWTRLAETFPDQFVGKTLKIEPIALNGAPMFRSEIGGFSSLAEADALCARLMASSEPCFVRRAP